MPQYNMDTSGLYIRIKKREDCNTEIAPGFRDYIKTTYTTWLFAGDNRRLVTHWVDTNYEYSFEQQDIYSDSEDGEYIRSDIDLSESYTEGYMYYKSGIFELKERDDVNNIDGLNNLLQTRP